MTAAKRKRKRRAANRLTREYANKRRQNHASSSANQSGSEVAESNEDEQYIFDTVDAVTILKDSFQPIVDAESRRMISLATLLTMQQRLQDLVPAEQVYDVVSEVFDVSTRSLYRWKKKFFASHFDACSLEHDKHTFLQRHSQLDEVCNWSLLSLTCAHA